MLIRKLKIAILYRVVQDWRAPVFERIAAKFGMENFKVFYGSDFANSKVVSTKNHYNFHKKKLYSFKIKFKGSYDTGYMPFSPFLIVHLFIFRPNVVLTEGASNLLNAIQGFIYCKLMNKKFVWWSLGELSHLNVSKKRKFLNPIINYIEKKSDVILTYSSQGKRYFESLGIPPYKIVVAVNVVDTDQRKAQIEFFMRSIKRDDRIINLVYAGAITKSKRLDILLDAFSIVLKKHRLSIKLNIIGDGPDKAYFQNYTSRLNLDAVVQFHGRKTDDMSKYFLENDILIMPGLGGLVISDAMVHGLAIITTNGDGCEKDLVDNNVNGFFISDLTPERLAEKIIILYNDRDLLAKFKIASLQKIENNYNIGTYMRKLFNAIE